MVLFLFYKKKEISKISAGSLAQQPQNPKATTETSIAQTASPTPTDSKKIEATQRDASSSFFCSWIKDGRYLISFKLMSSILKDKEKYIFIPTKDAYCLESNKAYNFTFVELDNLEKYAFYSRFNFDVQIRSIENNLSKTHIIANHKAYGFQSADRAQRTLTKIDANFFPALNQGQTFTRIRIYIPSQRPIPEEQGPATFHPYARLISKKDLSQLKQKNVVIIDTRPAKEFRQEAIPESINIPIDYTIWKRPNSPTELDRLTLDLSSLKRVPLDSPMVVYGHPKHFTAYNLLTILRKMGYQNLYYLPQGMFTWKEINSKTPKNYTGVRKVSHKGVLLGMGKVQIIDVRNLESYKFRSIDKSIHNEYHNSSENSLTDPRKTLGYRYQVEHSDRFNLDNLQYLKKDQPIILYGANAYDFRPLKAAIWMQEKGYSNVRWYRGGVEEWRSLEVLYPTRYKTTSHTTEAAR